MKDIYRKNRHSGQPMAIKDIDLIEFSGELNNLWLDRLITSLYIVLSVYLTIISLVFAIGRTL